MNTPVKAHPSIDPRVLDSPHTPYGRMEGAVDGAMRIVVSVGWACRVITRILWYPCDDCGLALPRTNDGHGGYAGRVVPHVCPPRVYGRMAVWAYGRIGGVYGCGVGGPYGHGVGLPDAAYGCCPWSCGCRERLVAGVVAYGGCRCRACVRVVWLP